MSIKTTAFRNLIIDMDGVLWRGDTPMPGLPDFFQALQDLQINFVLATNNATGIATQYAEKLQAYGVTVAAEAILTSAEATASYLQKRFPAGATAYVLGESGLRAAMQRNAFEVLSDEGFVDHDVRADVVVVGFTRYACYAQIASAAFLVNNGALFVGTNPDPTFPHEVGPLPGAGAFLAFIETATGCRPIIIGKPGSAIFEEALIRLGGTREETSMVGDRLETDIAGAHAAGLNSILLLSGVTSREKLAGSEVVPNLVFDDIRELTRHLLSKNGYVPKDHGR